MPVFAEVFENDSKVFKIAKQMDRTNQNVVGEVCQDQHQRALTLQQ